MIPIKRELSPGWMFRSSSIKLTNICFFLNSNVTRIAIYIFDNLNWTFFLKNLFDTEELYFGSIRNEELKKIKHLKYIGV